jgi:hypothetical protein
MDHGRAAAYKSVVDHGRWWPKDSVESNLAATPVGKCLPQIGEKREGSMGNLTGGDFGQWGDCVRLVMRKHYGGPRSMTRSSLE